MLHAGGERTPKAFHSEAQGRAAQVWVHDKNDISTPKGNAVKHFCSYIRQNVGAAV